MTLRRQFYFVFMSLLVAYPLICVVALWSLHDEGLLAALRTWGLGLLWWWALLGSQTVVFSACCGLWLDHYGSRWGAKRAAGIYRIARVVLAWPVLFGAVFLSGGVLLRDYEGGGTTFFLLLVIPACGVLDNLFTSLNFQWMRGAYPVARAAVAPEGATQPDN